MGISIVFVYLLIFEQRLDEAISVVSQIYERHPVYNSFIMFMKLWEKLNCWN